MLRRAELLAQLVERRPVGVVAVDVAQQLQRASGTARDRSPSGCCCRLSWARSFSWSRSQPCLATPMTGTFSSPVGAPCAAAPGRSACRPGRRWRRRTPSASATGLSLMPCFSWWPPNSKRMADSTWSAKSASPRELNRSKRAVVSTGAGTALVDGGDAVQRPSPESDTRPAKSSSCGLTSRAWAVRSSSQDEMTLPRRHTSVISLRSKLVLVELGIAQRRRLGVDRVRRWRPTSAWRRMFRPSA